MNKSDIDKIVEKVIKEDAEVPDSTYRKVDSVLKGINKPKKKNTVFNVMRTIGIGLAAMFILSGVGLATYTAVGGDWSKIPILNMLGVKSNSEYEEYVKTYDGPSLEKDGAKVTLTNYVCDDGYAIFELYVKLEDEAAKVFGHPNNEEFAGIYLSFNGQEDDEISMLNNENIIIDDISFPIKGRSFQSIEVVSDTEYMIHQFYFLTEKELSGKTDFNIILKNAALSTNIWEKSGADNEYLIKTKWIKFNGQFEINASKKKSVDNIKRIILGKEITDNSKSIYLNSAKITPFNIILDLDTIIKNANQLDIRNLKEDDALVLINYDVRNADNNKILDSTAYKVKKYIETSDGKIVDWEDAEAKHISSGDIKTKDYLVITGANNINNIIVTPYYYIEVPSRYDKAIEPVYLDSFNIDINKGKSNVFKADYLGFNENKQEEFNGDEILQKQIDFFVQEVNYFNYGVEDIAKITDDYKIVSTMNYNNNELGNTVKLEDFENIASLLFKDLPKNKSVKSEYIDIEYKNSKYHVIKEPEIGAVTFYTLIKNQYTTNDYESPKDAYDLDIIMITASNEQKVADAKIIIEHDGRSGMYIADYSQKVLENPIILETMNP